MCSIDALGVGYKVIKEASTEPEVGRGWEETTTERPKPMLWPPWVCTMGNPVPSLTSSQSAGMQPIKRYLQSSCLLLGMAQPAANAARELGPEEVGAL